MPVQTLPQISDFAKYFAPFQAPTVSVEKLVAAQTRNVEALTAAAQLTAESWQTVFQRQAAVFTQFAQEAQGGLKEMFAPGAPQDKLTQQVDLLKANLEKGLANFREVSDLIAKSNAEATDVLVKRVTESLTELKTSAPKKKAA